MAEPRLTLSIVNPGNPGGIVAVSNGETLLGLCDPSSGTCTYCVRSGAKASVSAVPLNGSVVSLTLCASGYARSVRVAVQAFTGVRKTKSELIVENALLRQQLIAAKRHLGRRQLAKPEKLVITLWSRLTTQWQNTLLLVQPDTVLRWHREMFRMFGGASRAPKATPSSNSEL